MVSGKQQYIIGVDFGNYNTIPCVLTDIDFEKGRLGGTPHDLLTNEQLDGIPSVFFYSNQLKKTAFTKPLPWYCEDAVMNRAVPVGNRIRLLKRNLGEKIKLDDKEFLYDEQITQVVQHCVRSANKVLKSKFLVETNQISLSYPVTYTCAQREHLIELVEKATLEDGRKLKVVGTIKEPAAAALDYFAVEETKTKEATVMVYDLGGGTFDLSIVTVYLDGKKDADGDLYYYNVANSRGIGSLGGAEFNDCLYELAVKKAGTALTERQKREIRSKVEEAKKELSRNEETVLLYHDYETDDDEQVFITRAQFERAAAALVKQTTDLTRAMLNNHKNQKPEKILLTGGASQMPMIKKALETEFPEYKGKIIMYRPARAIAYGAARYGCAENNQDPTPMGKNETKKGSVIDHLNFDLGVRYFRDANDKKGYITTFFKAGEVYPTRNVEYVSRTLSAEQRYSHYAVYEAKVPNPNPDNVYTDYTEIMAIDLDHERKCPVGTRSKTRLSVDKFGRLTIESWEMEKPDKPLKKTTVLKNLAAKQSNEKEQRRG